MTIDSTNIGGVLMAFEVTKIEHEEDVQIFAREEEMEEFYAGELEGDPFEFEADLGFFDEMALEESFCDFEAGDSICGPIGMRPMFSWKAPPLAGIESKAKFVMHDPVDGQFRVVRERASELEVEQFHSLVARCGIHPNALPRNIH